ncbi:fatty acid synthase subunit beta dehydratase [Calycina marina]|uniref:Fatty acid synthase subunit beta dehydratase n=1 Tax=Calycina marina TaxID=1763456 RepID=A0A9P7ZAU4_9HELO|nr:fatty acid synthase subunit beta dehydratase [Calycina marina]
MSDDEYTKIASVTVTSTPPSPIFSTPPSTASTSSEAISTRFLKLGSSHYSLKVPAEIYDLTTELHDDFLKELSLREEVVYFSDEHQQLSLLTNFLSFITQNYDDGATDSAIIGVLDYILDELDANHLRGRDIHSVISKIPIPDHDARTTLLSPYYKAIALTRRKHELEPSALLTHGRSGKARIYAMFGGQGVAESYINELQELHDTYTGFFEESLRSMSGVLQALASNPQVERLYPKGLDVRTWLRDQQRRPDAVYLTSAPVSMPLIGLTQLMHYSIICRILNITPGQFRESLKGVTGHSQGIVTAVAIAKSGSWPSFERASREALTILFWTGARSQQVCPVLSMPNMVLRDCAEHEESTPGPMLRVIGLDLKAVQAQVKDVNQQLPIPEHIHVALVNSTRNVIVAGPPMSLYGFSLKIRKLKAAKKNEQARTPFSKRGPTCSAEFLPITAPFHSRALASATEKIVADLQQLQITKSDLEIPVYHTETGENLQSIRHGAENLTPEIVQMITELPVHWESATKFQGATHVLDFGTGRAAGVGTLTHHSKAGTGLITVLTTVLKGTNSEFAYREALFGRDPINDVKYGKSWNETFRPRLFKTAAGRVIADTKMSRLLGLPPVMVSGMTPTTASCEFVAATINAGYHIEVAAGGYHNAEVLTAALRKIANTIPNGRGICLNVIYVDPRAINWQIPLVQSLIAEGFPIEGLTVGAGVPSAEIANTWITTLGLKYIAFKPGSTSAIKEVLALARGNPKFPILLQWTGGRGGGHHSYEDFHQPILDIYRDIRSCDNVVLVAGSGFGGSDSYEYLDGSWSLKYQKPAMPFDGALFGSRVMTALEAGTSVEAKQEIVYAEGVDNSRWEETYRGVVGGVITVKSEMGEPIHKLATRGVRLWSELDQTIFNLDKPKRTVKLAEKRDYIIKRLNDDAHRVWFAQTADSTTAELQDMTYHEVAERLIQLMYFPTGWYHHTWRDIAGDFLLRTEGRFMAARRGRQSRLSILQDVTDLDLDPQAIINLLFDEYPEKRYLSLETEDVDYLLMICRQKGRKPVPFILTLDETFEMSFKKDSLWQSEHVEAVFGQDIGRTCILQGPVAAKHSNVVNEPIKTILDGVNSGLIKQLINSQYAGDVAQIPYFESSSPSKVAQDQSPQTLTTFQDGDGLGFDHSTPLKTTTMDLSRWYDVLAGESPSWRRSVFTAKSIARGPTKQPNPVRDLFKPVAGLKVEVATSRDVSGVVLRAYEQVASKEDPILVAQLSSSNGRDIDLHLFESGTGRNCSLNLQFRYDNDSLSCPIHEIVEDRNERIKIFYQDLWFGKNTLCDKHKVTVSPEAVKEFLHSVGNTNTAAYRSIGPKVAAPMDFSMMVSWEAIMGCLFSAENLNSDFLRLVHLSNSFTALEDGVCVNIGDEITTSAKITAILVQDSGKMVQVTGTLERDGKPMMEVISKFLFRGTYTDFENCFEVKAETPAQLQLNATDVAVLRSRHCFQLDDPNAALEGANLIFRLHTTSRYQDKTTFSSMRICGDVWLERPNTEARKIGRVDCKFGTTLGNPVTEYLARKGTLYEPRVLFEHAVSLNHPSSKTTFTTPANNQSYAEASADYNPIHVSRLFAQYAGLPGPITHGMFTSAAVRGILEDVVSNNDPRRMKSWSCKFVGIALPGTPISVQISHIGMIAGRKLIKVKAVHAETEQVVLTGEAEVEQPATAYMFTGQGSQFQGMGMDLYAISAAARAVWDETDSFFITNYGFALTYIVRENPKDMTVYFGGKDGERVRENYMKMEFEHVQPDGSVKISKIFPSITQDSPFYTYTSPSGLLSATQFTQAALVFTEKAYFSDLRSRGLIQENATFAGHSLGEYSALTALAEVIPAESLASIVFYRGLIMQTAVQRDAEGRSNYGMCAVNPSRVSRDLTEQVLSLILKSISTQTNQLLEIVNFNVADSQYVCAGELAALATMGNVLDCIVATKPVLTFITTTLPSSIANIITAEIIAMKTAPKPIIVTRGHATIPLPGIDIPFHSTMLRPGVSPFRNLLLSKISPSNVDVKKLVGKYIPNLTGTPFSLSQRYVEGVAKRTGSKVLWDFLDKYPLLEVEGLRFEVSDGEMTLEK